MTERLPLTPSSQTTVVDLKTDLPSGDVDASVSVPNVPSVEVKKPKTGLLGGILGLRKSKAKIEVR